MTTINQFNIKCIEQALIALYSDKTSDAYKVGYATAALKSALDYLKQIENDPEQPQKNLSDTI